MDTFLEKVNLKIRDLENFGFSCGKLTTKERIEIYNLLNKSI